jgi:predicted amino acid dehydrogenase
VDSTVSIQLAVSLPVVVDCEGRQARGVTEELGLDSVSFLTDCKISPGTTLTLVLCFSHDVAYMPLSGRVTSVTEVEHDSPTRFRIAIALVDVGHTERMVLESAYHELETYLQTLEMPEGPARAAARTTLVTANPRSILSLFITDNPYPLQRSMSRKSTGTNAPSRSTQSPIRQTPEQSEHRPMHLSWSGIWEGARHVAQVFRDLFVRLLPAFAAPFLTTPITFAFIGHPRTLSDVARKFPSAGLLPSSLIERWLRYQWPLVGSYITGLTLTDGTPTTGAMLFSPMTTEQMLHNPRLARRRVLQTIHLAEKMGAKMAGLGAFASIVTRDGRELEGKVHVGLTTGNPQSAAIAVENVLQAAALTNLSLPHAVVAIVGGAGSVGSACAKMLARCVGTLFLIDLKKDDLQTLIAQLGDQPATIKGMTDLGHVREADVVIAATSHPRVLLTSAHLKPGVIVVDAAQPKNVSEEVPRQRPDVLVIESAVIQTPDVNVHFDLDLAPNEVLGCLSETMILTAIGWNGHYSLGKASPVHAAHIIAAGRSLGFRLAPFRNSSGYITEEDLQRVARARTM